MKLSVELLLQSRKIIVDPNWLRACAETDDCVSFEPYSFSPASVSSRPPQIQEVFDIVPKTRPDERDTSFDTEEPTEDPSISYKARLSTHRLSTLICPNQELALELAVIMKWRYLEGDPRSELSYSRSIAVSCHMAVATHLNLLPT